MLLRVIACPRGLGPKTFYGVQTVCMDSFPILVLICV